MFKKINLQFVISYLGLFPFITILLDRIFFNYFDLTIVRDFALFYSLIIFVFIGAVNWNLKKEISLYSIFMGFFPSLISVFIIIMFLFSYEVEIYLIASLIFQLVLDNFNYKEEKDRMIYYMLRTPLTLFIVLFLLFI
tara:strand:+ start:108 stop:521 length:414 start_codon:yes stop_codon:yes gene_type:complete